jgi:hypothetical protein
MPYVRNAWGGFDPAPKSGGVKTDVASKADATDLVELLGRVAPETPEPTPTKPELTPVIVPAPVMTPQGRVRMSLSDSIKNANSTDAGNGEKICTLTGDPLGKCRKGPAGCVPGDAAGWSGKADF